MNSVYSKPEFKHGEICLLRVDDPSRECGYRFVDMGDYYTINGEKVLLTSSTLVEKYGHLVDVPVYVRNNRHQADKVLAVMGSWLTAQLLDKISNCCDGAENGWDAYADDAVDVRKWVIKTRELLRSTAT